MRRVRLRGILQNGDLPVIFTLISVDAVQVIPRGMFVGSSELIALENNACTLVLPAFDLDNSGSQRKGVLFYAPPYSFGCFLALERSKSHPAPSLP